MGGACGGSAARTRPAMPLHGDGHRGRRRGLAAAQRRPGDRGGRAARRRRWWRPRTPCSPFARPGRGRARDRGAAARARAVPSTSRTRVVYRPWGSYETTDQGHRLPREAAGREPRAEAVAPDASSSRRALGGRAGHGAGGARRRDDRPRRERVDLHPERYAAPAREPGPDPAPPGRGADRAPISRRTTSCASTTSTGADPWDRRSRSSTGSARPPAPVSGAGAGAPARLLARGGLEARRGAAPRGVRDRAAGARPATSSPRCRIGSARPSWRRICAARGAGSSGARSSTRRSAWRASWRGAARRRARSSSRRARPRVADASAGSGTRRRG